MTFLDICIVDDLFEKTESFELLVTIGELLELMTKSLIIYYLCCI